MNKLYQRCFDNDIDVDLLDQAQLKLAEPNITGRSDLCQNPPVSSTTKKSPLMAQEFVEAGGNLALVLRWLWQRWARRWGS